MDSLAKSTKLPDKFHQTIFNTGVDFAGSTYHRASKQNVGKTYTALFTRTTIRAVNFMLCKDLSTFLRTRGRLMLKLHRHFEGGKECRK